MEQNKRRIPPPPPRPFPPRGKTETQNTSTGDRIEFTDDRKLDSVVKGQSNVKSERTVGSEIVDNEKDNAISMQQSSLQSQQNQIDQDRQTVKTESQTEATVGEGIGAMRPQEDLLVKKAPEKQKGLSRKIQLPLYILGSVLCFALAGVCIFLLLK